MRYSSIILLLLLFPLLGWSFDIESYFKRNNISGDQVLIYINKSDHRLSLYIDYKLKHTYRVVFGRKGMQDKQVSGDKKTPEGAFYICSKWNSKRFVKFLGINYPSPEDAKRGLERGLITKRQYNQILESYDKGECPPAHTQLGGAIGIHGFGKFNALLVFLMKIGVRLDWTSGCIAMSNKHVRAFYNVIPIGSRVYIER
jgi:murein L,D-transpeptidase YafK